MTAGHSYDAGEQIRVTKDDRGVLRVHHGAHEIATIKRVLGKGTRIQAGTRTWMLTSDDHGWTAEGDPPASLSHRALRSHRLTIGDDHYGVRKRSVRGPQGKLLTFDVDKNGAKPILRGEIHTPPPETADAHATIALATAAVVLGVDLDRPPPHVPAAETPAASAGFSPGPG